MPVTQFFLQHSDFFLAQKTVLEEELLYFQKSNCPSQRKWLNVSQYFFPFVFQVFSKNGVKCNLSTQRVKDLEQSEKDVVVDLLIRNMKALYQKSNWGWNEKNKRSEMMEDAAWYLLAKNEDGKICGFSHFRYDMDYDDEVLYVYEVCNMNHHGVC